MQGAVTSHAYDPNTPEMELTVDSGTPDCYANYWFPEATCYFNGSAGAGAYVNFYNTNDWALSVAWETFENAKPLVSLGYSFAAPSLYYGDFGLTELYFPDDRYPIFSAIIQSRSYALGMQPGVNGVFKGDQVNLPSVWPPDPTGKNYSAHLWHSAEFRSDNPQRWLFWDEVLFQMGIKNSL